MVDHNNLPTFTQSAYGTHTVSLINPTGSTAVTSRIAGLQNVAHDWFTEPPNNQQRGENHMSAPAVVKNKLRIVRVFLVDPDERVPLDKRVLHRSDELTTDATDQELYFDIPVNDLLKAHNVLRANVEWEEKTEGGTRKHKGLKEARIRDLVMSVTTVASF